MDNAVQYAALNALYDQLWVYYNLFQPVMHMVDKEVVDGKLRRKHDRAQTPYQRLLTCKVLSPEQEARLADLYAKTNPRQLRRQIYAAVQQLWEYPQPDTTTRKEAALAR